MQETVEALSKSIYEKLKDRLSLTKDKANFRLDGNQTYNKSLDSHIINARFDINLRDHSDMDLSGLIKGNLVSRLLEDRETAVSDTYSQYDIGHEVVTGDLYVIEDNGISPLNFDAWKSTIPDDDYELLYANRIMMVVAFDPHKGLSWNETIQTTTGPKEYPHYNRHIAADWTRIDPPTDLSIVEKYIPEFLEHFIPIKEERDYLIYWLYRLSFKRCQDVVVLVGTQGNGKNSFMNLAAIITGEHNAIMASKSFGKDKFNTEVCRRKLVNLDEYALTDGEVGRSNTKDAIKSWCNDKITVEAKGIDPRSMSNHCSFIIANNAVTSVKLEYKDRRFTVPTLASTDIKNVWGVKRVQELQDVINDNEEFRLKFPHWIRRIVEEQGINLKFNELVLKTPRFYEIAEISKPAWFKSFKRLLEVSDVVTRAAIGKQNKNSASDDKIIMHINKEAEERRDKGIEPFEIATPTVQEGKYIYKSNIFKPEETEAEITVGDGTKFKLDASTVADYEIEEEVRI